MNKWFQSSLGMLALALALAGCSTPPYSRQPAYRAPVADRSTRTPQTYAQSRPVPVDTGRMSESDPLLPREYSSSYPAEAPYPDSSESYGSAPTNSNSNAYYGRAPAQPYERGPGSYSQPTYPSSATTRAQTYPTYPPPQASSGSQRYPTYPSSRPQTDDYVDDYAGTASQPESGYPAYSQEAEGSGERASASGLLPEPQPVMPQTRSASPSTRSAPITERSSSARSTESTVAMATPAPTYTPPAEASPAPMTAPAAPARPMPPSDLPPAEITREGNQAVAALLDSADKYAKSNQLDKAGAALERALRIEPRNAGIWHDLAQIRLHQGQYQQAESLASKSNNLANGNQNLQSRNWKLISAARKASGNTRGAEEAEAQASQSR